VSIEGVAVARVAGWEIEDTPYITAIWLDPGGTTGWCVMSVLPEALSDPDMRILDNIYHWTSGQIVGPEPDQADEIAELITAWPGALVGIESFELRQFRKDRDLLSPVRIGAMVEWAALRGGGAGVRADAPPAVVEWQSPSLAKKTASDDSLKEWGLYRREGGEEHARDATRHAITFYRRCKSGAQGSKAGETRARHLRARAWPYRFAEDEGPDGSATGAGIG